MPYLDPSEILSLIDLGGPISRAFKNFELRPQQAQMLDNIVEAYNKNSVALIQAGTGTGKSIAYLLPAIMWAIKHSERTVIATHTIALQEQLLTKDIPQLLQALQLNIKIALVKGMGNYICLRKYIETSETKLLSPEEEKKELDDVNNWLQFRHDGSRSAINFPLRASTWEKIAAEKDSCTNVHCPYYSSCFFFKARKWANDAQIIVTNHSLLFADISLRSDSINNSNKIAILPEYRRIVIDEAHHLEDVATKFLSKKVSPFELQKILVRLLAEKHGRVPLLFEKITQGNFDTTYQQLYLTYSNELSGQWRQLLKDTLDLFDNFASYADLHEKSEKEVLHETKFRILKHHLSHEMWNKQIIPKAKNFCENIEKLAQSIESWSTEAFQLANEKILEQVKGLSADIVALVNRLRLLSTTLKSFIKEEWLPEDVRWIEQRMLSRGPTVTLFNATLDLSKILAENLFNSFATIILCSATLSTNNNFKFIRQRLGLVSSLIGDRNVMENIYHSPFDFSRQALLVIPNDLPPPSDIAFTQQAAQRVCSAIESSNGNAFVLFTSYGMLASFFDIIAPQLSEKGYTLMKQGDSPRHQLLQSFIAKERSVLFGTNSFWEGIDVTGDALRCVIIVKLPFQVPTEPIIEARYEAIRFANGNPFLEYSLPLAIIKFIQGTGRLVRHKFDRGCIVCLDNRLIQKNYGKQFLESLHKQNIFVGNGAQIEAKMKEFYKNTYYLVQKQKK